MEIYIIFTSNLRVEISLFPIGGRIFCLHLVGKKQMYESQVTD